MRIYYDEATKNVVLGQSNRLFATGSLVASNFRGRVSIVYKDTNLRELFLPHDRIKKQDGSPAGADIQQTLDYLNGEFNKSPFDGGGAQATPTKIPLGTVFLVAEDTQVLFSEEIELDGELDLDGVLIEVN